MNYRCFNKKEVYEEKPSKSLKFLYNRKVGRGLLKIATKPMMSKFAGKVLSTKVSTCKIKSFIKKNNIDMSQFEEKKYISFNDFFTRKLKNNKFESEQNDFVATANSRITCYDISDDLIVDIKNTKYSIKELIKDSKLAEEYKGGLCIIYRLLPSNFHRYLFCDNGSQKQIRSIKGRLHTVNPIVYDKYKVYTENYREVSSLDTENFGKIIQIEVGALCVGKIVNYDVDSFNKYDEKGYFEFGGSTIVQLVSKGKVDIDKQIIENTKESIETLVNVGEIIGKKTLLGDVL